MLSSPLSLMEQLFVMLYWCVEEILTILFELIDSPKFCSWLVGFLLIYQTFRYLTRNHNYWSNLGIPGPRPLPFFGTYLGQFFTPFQMSEVERFEKYGDVYGIYDGTQPGLIIGKPEIIKQILTGQNAHKIFKNRRAVKTTHPIMSKFLSSLEDKNWDRVHQITAPSLTNRKLRAIIPTMTEASENMVQTLEILAQEKKPVDLKLLYSNYTMEVIAKSAFATIPDANFVHQASQLFTFPFWRKFLDYVIPMTFLEFFKFTVLPPRPMDFFRNLTLQIIHERKTKADFQHQDVLQLLMNAHSITNPLANREFPEYLSEDEILAQSVLFFSVGFETSSQLLAYTSYCLALNPQVQEKAYEEVQEAVKSNDDQINQEVLKNVDYLTAVIDESLRLYNPVLRMERRASEDFVLEKEGITIPKGMVVGVPVWALHHSKKYFPNPYEFIPERFLGEKREAIKRSFTYLPFGEGPRSCIGLKFALLECKLALIEILLKFKFFQIEKTKIPLEFYPTGRPLLGPRAIFVGVERRQ